MFRPISENLSLSDFNLHHFKTDGQDLQAIIPSYEEYRVIVRENEVDEELIPPSQYFQHQRIVHQILQSPDIDRLLITHVAGAGKTGSYIGYAQYAKHQWLLHQGDRLNQPIIQKTLFLASGPAQVNDIRRMTVCVFGGSEYLVTGKSATSQRILIDNLVKKWYEIVPYRVFTARMWVESQKAGLTVKEYIKKRYAGYLVIVDEVHNLNLKINELRDIINRTEYDDYEGLVIEQEIREADLTFDEDIFPSTKLSRGRGKGKIKGRGDGRGKTSTGGRSSKDRRSKKAISKKMVVEAILNLADFAPNVKIIIGSATLIVKDREDLRTPMMMLLKNGLRREFLEMDLYRISEDDIYDYVEAGGLINVTRPLTARDLDRLSDPEFQDFMAENTQAVQNWSGKDEISADDVYAYIRAGNIIEDQELTSDNIEDLTNEQLRSIRLHNTERILEWKIHPYIKNRVSHVEALMGKWKRVMEGHVVEVPVDTEDGEEIQEVTVYPVEMVGYQLKKYLEVHPGSKGNVNNDIYTSVKQASVFVYPNGRSGTEAFKLYIREVSDKGFGYRFGRELDELLKTKTEADRKAAWEYLREHSAIYYDICQKLNDDHTFRQKITRIDLDEHSSTYGQKITEARNVGVIAIYIEYMRGPGIILLGLLLERFCGMTRFRSAGRIIGHRDIEEGTEPNAQAVSDYCPSSGSTIVNLSKKARYAIIHSSTSLSVLDNAKNILKSNDNVNGEYIRVALIPKEGREGVSINSAVAFIRVGSDWNPAWNYQAEKRVFRENSSDSLVRNILNSDNPDLIFNYLDNGALKIRVYNMVAVFTVPASSSEVTEAIEFTVGESSDNSESSSRRSRSPRQSRTKRNNSESPSRSPRQSRRSRSPRQSRRSRSPRQSRRSRSPRQSRRSRSPRQSRRSRSPRQSRRSRSPSENSPSRESGGSVKSSEDRVIDWRMSIGTSIYAENLRRDVGNAPMRRIYKRAAIDCHLNRKRNTLPRDLDGTTECDYGKCDYGCYTEYDPLEAQIVTTNYNNMFYDATSDTIANLIIKFFETYKETNITYLIRYIQDVLRLNREVFIPILRSLEDLIRRQVSFTNQFGYSTHIMTSGDRVFISNGNVDNPHYIESLHGQKTGISKTLEDSRAQLRRGLLNEFLKNINRKIKDQRIEVIRIKFGNDLQEIQNTNNKDLNADEDSRFIELIRKNLYQHEYMVLIVESVLETYITPEEKLDNISKGILYVTRNHWAAVPYPDQAIATIKVRGTTAASQARKRLREVPIRYQFNPEEDIASKSKPAYIIHDLASWHSSVNLNPFYNAEGPFRVVKMNRNAPWQEYSIDGTRLIEYHAFRESFRRAKTYKLFNEDNDMILPGNKITLLYGIILGSKDIAVIDHTPNELDPSSRRRNSKRPTTAAKTIKPYLKTRSGAKTIYQYIYDEEPSKSELRDFQETSSDIISDVRDAIIRREDIIYL